MSEAEATPQNGVASKVAADIEELMHEKIVTQIEYYFGDVNLTKDRFLNEQIKKDDGWVPIETLLTFNRLSNICSDAATIAEALTNSSLIKVSDDKSKVRRDPSKPMPEASEELRKELMKRTVYCKGFPTEGVTLDDLLAFFKKFGSVDSVILRHFVDKATEKKGFKGSTFTIFSTVEEADKFIKLEEVSFNGNPLNKLWQSDYIDGKRKERLDNKLSKLMRRRKNGPAPEKDGNGENKEDGNKTKKKCLSLPAGSVLNLTNIPSDIDRDEIRRSVESQEFPVAFVDVAKGDTSGFVRLENAGTAAEFVAKLGESRKLKMGNGEAEIRALEGEEEANYLERACSQITKARLGHKKISGKHRRKRRNPGSGDNSEPRAKVPAH